jgi:cytochrome c oxidase subunit 2
MVLMRDILKKFHIQWLLAVAALLVGRSDAFAMEVLPKPWALNWQPAFSPTMQRIHDFHDYVLIVIVLITLFVLGLIVYIGVKFHETKNPVPSKTTHNSLLEVLWTAVPVIILVVIAIPSLKLLYFMDKTDNPEMTLKIIGHQWYWSYEYPDNGKFTFDSVMVPSDEIKPGQHRLLSVDNSVVLPVDTNVRLLMTSADVIHAWAVPPLLHKIDAVPGRINESWFKITAEGTYYGQCSELCGINHGFMPIRIEAVSKDKFKAWVAAAQKKFAKVDGEPIAVAEATNSR